MGETHGLEQENMGRINKKTLWEIYVGKVRGKNTWSAINGDVPEVTEDNVSNLDNVSSSDSCSVQETEQPSPSQENSETSNASANKVREN